jgi:SAM-dependent methyltransferase
MGDDPGDVFHVSRDEEYLRQLEAEAAYYDQPRFFTIDAELPFAADYLNERFSGDSGTPWYETISNYGTFRRGCALGAGGAKQRSRVLEDNPALHLTVYDISEQSLAELDRELGGRFPGRVATERADLNFVELPENTYDLIISAGCLHHLLNLEHVAYQANRSLVPEGFFFLHDYVGEARFQFAPEKRRLFESAFEEAKDRHVSLRSWRIVWPDLSDWQHSPFEAIRSDETLEILERYLAQVSVRTVGGLLFLMLHLRPADGAEAGLQAAPSPGWSLRLASAVARIRGHRGRQAPSFAAVLEELGPELAPMDSQFAEEGVLRPGVAFAVYKKRREA